MKPLPNSSILWNRRKYKQTSKSTPWTVKQNDPTSRTKKRKTQKMERMEQLQRVQNRIAADVEEQSNIGKKNAKHKINYRQTCHLCPKPNHFATVWHFKNKPAGRKTVNRGHNSMKQVTKKRIRPMMKWPKVKIHSLRSRKSPAWRCQASN